MTTAVSADWVVPVDGPPLKEGYVAWEDGRIVEVSRGRAERHFPGAAIVPGLVNAHSHLEYAVYGGFGDGAPFSSWLALHIERKARLDLPAMEAIARLGAAECLASGITTVGDASYAGAAATACAELGLRGLVYLEVFGATAEQIATRYEANRHRLGGSLPERVRLGISPHSLYTASLELWRAAAELGVPIATHLAESQAEVDWIRRREGPFKRLGVAVEPVSLAELDAHGLLTDRIAAAHCVKLDASELELLARRDVAVVHCPRSNAYLGCGIAPLAEMRAKGLRIGLGTDSPASAPSFDLFDEMRAAILAARAREERADALTARDALALATLGSARVLGFDSEVGSLTPGKRADLAVVSVAGSPYDPVEEPAVAVVFGGSPAKVLETIVDGQTRYRQGETTWHEVRSTASAARRRMLA